MVFVMLLFFALLCFCYLFALCRRLFVFQLFDFVLRVHERRSAPLRPSKQMFKNEFFNSHLMCGNNIMPHSWFLVRRRKGNWACGGGQGRVEVEGRNGGFRGNPCPKSWPLGKLHTHTTIPVYGTLGPHLESHSFVASPMIYLLRTLISIKKRKTKKNLKVFELLINFLLKKYLIYLI